MGFRSVLFPVVSMLVSASAEAGVYELTVGQGKDVCEAYRRNLQPHHESTPMACERTYDPAITGFTAPHWKRLELATHMPLYREAYIYLQEHNDSPQGTKPSDKDIEANAGKLSATSADELYTAELDVLGDGRLRKVLQLRFPTCGPDETPGSHQATNFFLDDSGKHINGSVPEDWNSYYNATWQLYRGKVYLEFYQSDDNWGVLMTSSGALQVIRLTRSGTEVVCRIQWTPATQTEN
jgi:hypothetical protein